MCAAGCTHGNPVSSKVTRTAANGDGAGNAHRRAGPSSAWRPSSYRRGLSERPAGGITNSGNPDRGERPCRARADRWRHDAGGRRIWLSWRAAAGAPVTLSREPIWLLGLRPLVPSVAWTGMRRKRPGPDQPYIVIPAFVGDLCRGVAADQGFQRIGELVAFGHHRAAHEHGHDAQIAPGRWDRCAPSRLRRRAATAVGCVRQRGQSPPQQYRTVAGAHSMAELPEVFMKSRWRRCREERPFW